MTRPLWRTILWTVIAALAAVTLVLLFALLAQPAPKAAPAPKYTIGEWGGQVAVFEGDQTYPKQVYDSYVSALPKEQQAQVEAGIPVTDDTQLSLLLEDLTS